MQRLMVCSCLMFDNCMAEQLVGFGFDYTLERVRVFIHWKSRPVYGLRACRRRDNLDLRTNQIPGGYGAVIGLRLRLEHARRAGAAALSGLLPAATIPVCQHRQGSTGIQNPLQKILP